MYRFAESDVCIVQVVLAKSWSGASSFHHTFVLSNLVCLFPNSFFRKFVTSDFLRLPSAAAASKSDPSSSACDTPDKQRLAILYILRIQPRLSYMVISILYNVEY